MTCENPIKNKIQNILGGWFDMFLIQGKLTDDQMELCNSEFAVMIQGTLRRFLFLLLIEFILLKYVLVFLVENQSLSF
ncbi:hypothetical protein N9U76_02200 [Prochlorococcus sp. AH-736-L19]|nr:hypothetical protein [Prochlorococcus sp. AH-736-L19]MDA9704230.1 hypothetical protein [Prochlorococcus sp. AH-736-L19]